MARIQQVLLTGGHYKETPEGINEVDGKYGRRTFNAVRELQRKYGLEDDGVVGPDTIAALQIEEAQQALAAGTQLTPEQRAALGNELADIAGLENMPITDKLKDEVRGLLTGIEAVEGLADERNISTSLPDIRDKAGLGPTA